LPGKKRGRGMTGIVAIVWLVGVIAAIRFVVRPKPDWPLVSTKRRALGIGLLVFFGVPLLAQLANHGSSSQPTIATPPAPSNVAVASAATTDASTPLPTNKWEYSEDTDAMRGTKTKYAMLQSENELDFGFPYGSNKATLTVRQRPSDGLNIVLQVKGQFLCNEFNSEHVAAKFDERPIENYGCTEASDASTGYLFIGSSHRFLARLKGAKTLILEAPFFQNGRQQMTFDVRGLVWK
jgi:hypothetical protein